MAELSKSEFKLLTDLWMKILIVSRNVSYLQFYYDVPRQDDVPDKIPKILTELVADVIKIKMDLMGFIEQDLEERFLLEKMLTERVDAKNEGWAET